MGHAVLLARRQWAVALVSFGALAALVTVNLSYPLWQGGWATGPRFLLPALPLVALGIAPIVSLGRRTLGGRVACAATVLLGVVGAAIALVSAAVGGRFPLDFADPLWEFARPRWMSGDFGRTVCWLGGPAWAGD